MTTKQNQDICPICGGAESPANRPFCSKRCADLDLHRWLSGSYAVPTEEAPDEAEWPALAAGDMPASVH